MLGFHGAGALSLAVVAVLAAGCSANPRRDCLDYCNEQNDRMCNGRDGTSDCDAECATAEAEYDEAVTTANRIGCRGEFDSFYGCLTGTDPCLTDRCGTELRAVQSCTVAYCTANPTDPECTGP